MLRLDSSNLVEKLLWCSAAWWHLMKLSFSRLSISQYKKTIFPKDKGIVQLNTVNKMSENIHAPVRLVPLFGKVTDCLVASVMFVLKEKSKLFYQYLCELAECFQVCRTKLLKKEFEICGKSCKIDLIWL